MDYRKDVDGLRALAVLPVLFYHIGYNFFSGGYVGVDIFFVISGYLITSIIINDLAVSKFSIVNFYERRIRRIFPALYTVLTFSSVAGWLLLLPNTFVNYANTLFMTVFYSSNIRFYKESGYFDGPSHQKPLLHTWSLSVEEQFYIFFPIILIITAKYLKKSYKFVVSIIFVLSLLLSLLTISKYTEFNFYMLPTRAWELLMGSILAIKFLPDTTNRKLSEVLSIFGISLILFSIFTYDFTTLFPGYTAAAPCFGTFLVIYSGMKCDTFLKKIISLKPIVYIGLLSYSLYLWHWPLIVFFKYYCIIPLTKNQEIFILLLSFLLSVLTYHFIETPFRKKIIFKSRAGIFTLGFMLMLVFSAFSVYVAKNNGIESRIDKNALSVLSGNGDKSVLFNKCLGLSPDILTVDSLCNFGQEGKESTFLLWGDSHAGVLIDGIKKSAEDNGKRGNFVGRSAALLHVTKYSKGISAVPDEHHKNIIKFLENNTQIKDVYLSARWAMYYNGTSYGMEKKFEYPITVFYNQNSDIKNNKEVFYSGLENTLSELTRLNRNIYIVAQIPEVGVYVPYYEAMSIITGSNVRISPAIEEYMERNKGVFEVFENLSKKYKFTVIYPDKFLCEDGKCKLSVEGKSLYIDTDHLSKTGSIYVKSMFDEYMKK